MSSEITDALISNPVHDAFILFAFLHLGDDWTLTSENSVFLPIRIRT